MLGALKKNTQNYYFIFLREIRKLMDRFDQKLCLIYATSTLSEVNFAFFLMNAYLHNIQNISQV